MYTLKHMSDILELQRQSKIKLAHILSVSKCNHKLQILKVPDIKTAHIYCKENLLSGQVSGPLIEHIYQGKIHYD